MAAQPYSVLTIEDTINEIVERLIRDYHPKQIVLFGSQATGRADADSDIDLLIIKETTETPLERRVRVRRLVSDPQRRIPFSPLVLTPVELAQRLAKNDPFYRQILKDGRVLYAQQ